MHDITDEELAERWQAGDTKSYEELYNRHWAKTVTRAFAVLRDTGDAEDVSQEVWSKFAIRPFVWDRQLGKFRPWIEKCATNKAIERWRRNSHRRTDPADYLEELNLPDPSDISEEVATAVDRDRLRLRIRECLQRLSAPERQLLIYVYYDKLPITEISQRLSASAGRKVPVGTVNSRLHKIRRKLRNLLEHIEYRTDGGKSDDQ